MNSIIGVILLFIGLLFNLFGCIGLIRFPDVYNRLQAGTKCVTLGTSSMLLGILFFFGFSEAGIKAVITIPLLFLTASVAAHALIRGSYIFGVKIGDQPIKDDYKEQVEADEKNEVK